MSERSRLQPALDAMATVEAAAVTVIGVARQRGLDGDLDVGDDAVIVLRAAQCQDEQHYHALLAAGAKEPDEPFTVSETVVTDRTLLLVTLLELKSVGIAGYMALARGWAADGDVDQVEITYQIGVVEAQHLTLAHALVGVTPANDRAFARWLFADASEAKESLRTLGLLAGTGEPVAFPGPMDRICKDVFGLTPETTAAMTLPRPSIGDPAAVAVPVATPAASP